MKCPQCRSTMDMLGSRITDDERQVLTHYCCLTCGKRVLHSETNPRYVPTPKGTAGPPRYRMPILDEALEAERDIIQIAIQHAGITIAPPLTPRQIIAIGAHKPNGIHAQRHAAPLRRGTIT